MTRLPADRPLFTLTSELVQVIQAARAREQSGERVLHLERGEPDFDTPPTSSRRWPPRRAPARPITPRCAGRWRCARR